MGDVVSPQPEEGRSLASFELTGEQAHHVLQWGYYYSKRHKTMYPIETALLADLRDWMLERQASAADLHARRARLISELHAIDTLLALSTPGEEAS